MMRDGADCFSFSSNKCCQYVWECASEWCVGLAIVTVGSRREELEREKRERIGDGG